MLNILFFTHFASWTFQNSHIAERFIQTLAEAKYPERVVGKRK